MSERDKNIAALRAKLVGAITADDNAEMLKVCQEIYDAGLEFEDMKLTPSMAAFAMNIIVASEWIPA